MYFGTNSDFDPLPDGGDQGTLYELLLICSDAAGNESRLELDEFLLDRTPPDTDGNDSESYDGVTYELSDIQLNNNTHYWNSFHTQITVTVSSLPQNDNTMLGGSIRLMAKVDNGSYEFLGSSESIPLDDVTDPVTITVQNANISSDGFEDLTEFSEGSTVYIAAVIYDRAGNRSTPLDNHISVVIDQVSPSSGIIELVPKIENNNGNSIEVQGYWNIDTDRLNVSLEDLTGKDIHIVNGSVQLRGNISSNNTWINLGTPKTIGESDDLTNFSIFVRDQTGWDGTGDGIENIPLDWSAEDGNIISIEARIKDAAGNYRDWTSNTELQIDGITADDRPTAISATADKSDGWWGPNSDELPIQIQIETSHIITVDQSNGTPTILLNTGNSVTGSAEYSGRTETTLSFAYTPTIGETSQGNVNENGEIDNRLEFKLDDNGEAIIYLNGAKMYEISGNLLVTANSSDNPSIPTPNTAQSLDGVKNIIIDGVAPDDLDEQTGPVVYSARGGTAHVRYGQNSGSIWEQIIQKN